MTREQVLNDLTTTIYDYFPDLAGTALNESTVISSETTIDSMGFILVMCRLEAMFQITIPETEWATYSTIGDVVDAVMRRLPC